MPNEFATRALEAADKIVAPFSGEGRDDASAARADPELGVATLEVVGGDVRGAELVTREAPHARASQCNDTENEEMKKRTRTVTRNDTYGLSRD